MGQVPQIGIIGDGRVARHFAHYFSLLGIASLQWSRSSGTGAFEAALQGFLSCTAILVLVKDDAIEPVIEAALRAKPELAAKPWIHFSGALSSKLAGAAHPLMTFGPALYDRKVYEEIPFICDPGLDLGRLLGIANPFYPLAREERAYYHALCVMGGNFTSILWRKLFDELERRFEIPREAALPYLIRTSANIAADAESALTGPLQRRDWGTVSRNLAALQAADDPFHEIYRAFVGLYDDREAREQQEMTL